MDTQTSGERKLPCEKAYITLVLGNHRQTLELGDFFTIGRGTENKLILTHDPYASHRHARIEFKNKRYFIRDLRSRNGTMVNGTLILEAELQDQDRLSIGQSALIFSHQKENQTFTLQTQSHNPQWQSQLKLIPAMAQSDLAVLITGPSGVGKELLAETLHRQSSRSSGPFMSVNCSALSESLVESELFGHLEGSFTGATKNRKGAFEAARGGTLFLDEIGDLPLHLQPKLLRALESEEIKPVGSDRSVATDVRIIAATNQKLQEKIRRGEFREDLYYRINVLQLKPPSLRNRMEDFEDLLYYYCKCYRIGFSFAAIEELKTHPWPGNIRELKNLVARAAALFRGHSVTPVQLDQILDRKLSTIPSLPPVTSITGVPMLKEIEKQLICERLIANHGNQRLTALELGLPKSTLHDRIKVYQIKIKELMAEEQ